MKKVLMFICAFFCCFISVRAEEVFTADMSVLDNVITVLKKDGFNNVIDEKIKELEEQNKKFVVSISPNTYPYSSLKSLDIYIFIYKDDVTDFSLKRLADSDRSSRFYDDFYLSPYGTNFEKFLFVSTRSPNFVDFTENYHFNYVNFNETMVIDFWNYSLDGTSTANLLYYTNVHFSFDFEDDVTINFKSSFYGTQKITNLLGWQFNRYFMLKNYIDGSAFNSTPDPTISTFGNATDTIDDVDVVTSTNVKIDFQFINDNFKYFYSKDDGLTWEEYTDTSSVFTFSLTDNATIKAKIYNNKTQKYENETSLKIDFIGKSSQYYENYIKKNYATDLDGSTSNISWSSGPADFINYYLALLKETYPIIWQIPKIINLFQFDVTTSPYCSHVATEKGLTYVCSNFPKLKIDFYGIKKEINIIDFSLLKDNRDLLFGWLKFFMALWTVLAVFRNVERRFSNG